MDVRHARQGGFNVLVFPLGQTGKAGQKVLPLGFWQLPQLLQALNLLLDSGGNGKREEGWGWGGKGGTRDREVGNEMTNKIKDGGEVASKIEDGEKNRKQD